MKRTTLLVLVLALGSAADVTNADFVFGTPTNLGPTINSSSFDWAPNLSADGLSLYFSSRRPGGLGADDIYVSTRATTDDPWGEPVNLGPPVNTSDWDQFTSISADGLTLYLNSNRPGGLGEDDLYVSTRATTGDPWKEPANLGPTVNSSFTDACPSISSDGRTLLFMSDRPGGHGSIDLWVTTRKTTEDDWSEPVNLGPTINSARLDGCPDISAVGLTLFFLSSRPGGEGRYDLYMTTRVTIDDPWEEPVNLGPIINTWDLEQSPNISDDGTTLYFGSVRPGGSGDMDIWQVSILPVVDFNGDGKVDFKDFRLLAIYWGQDESSCDIAPLPHGDGIVDTQDLHLLAEYLLQELLPVAQWKLDEAEGSIAYDSVGENEGTVHGSPVWQPIGGKVDGALQLDGVDDHVSTGFILDPAKESFSVFAWIKEGGPGQVIISQTDGTGFGTRWLWADSSYGRLITRLMHPPFDPLVSESVITDGQWHHVGLVYDFIKLHRYLYVDGVEVAKDTDFVGGLGSDGGMYFGAGKTLDTGSFWSGLIDDVRFYEVALSEEEIAVLAQ